MDPHRVNFVLCDGIVVDLFESSLIKGRVKEYRRAWLCRWTCA